jgi:hypothetical protein
MPKSKLRKNHKEKVAARNKKIQDDKNRMKKLLKAAYLEQMKQQNEEQVNQ